MNIPRIVIAGTHSGCGKTTVAIGIMAALVRQGRTVQPFKIGPDYIDPMFHSDVTGRPSRNLDAWLLAPDVLCHLLTENAKDCELAVIEGVMGMYDGFGGTSIEGSTARIAQITDSPVLLVVDAGGMSLSVAALIKGYQAFVPGFCLGGVILNNISTESHFQLLKHIIEIKNGLKVVGWLPKDKELELSSRHLGLVPREEQDDLGVKINKLAEIIATTVDLDLVREIAGQAGILPGFFHSGLARFSGVKIGVAKDKAFNFYYRDNLDLLETMGAELNFFSPMEDTAVPGDINGLYLGGGFPEVFAAALQNNEAMRNDIRGKAEAGMPIYAECGGLMYLCRSLKDTYGRIFQMCGVFEAHSEMTASLQRFGYVTVRNTADNLLGSQGATIRGHEFHYSITVPENETVNFSYSFQVTKQKANGEEIVWRDGFQYKNALGSYPHFHFWSNPEFAAAFLKNCAIYGEATL